MSRESRDSVSFDNDRAVMTGRMGIKYAFQYRFAKLGVRLDSTRNMSPQGILALNHHKRAHSVSHQVGQTSSQNVGGFGTKRRRSLGKAPHRDRFKNLSQLFLKNHHDHDQENGEEALKDPSGQLEPDLARDDVYDNENKKSAHDEGGARSFDPDARRVKHHGDKQDIDDVRQSNVEKWIEHATFSSGGVLAAQSAALSLSVLAKRLPLEPQKHAS